MTSADRRASIATLRTRSKSREVRPTAHSDPCAAGTGGHGAAFLWARRVARHVLNISGRSFRGGLHPAGERPPRCSTSHLLGTRPSDVGRREISQVAGSAREGREPSRALDRSPETRFSRAGPPRRSRNPRGGDPRAFSSRRDPTRPARSPPRPAINTSFPLTRPLHRG